MANLPNCQLTPHSPPFHYTSCDYFGPITVKVGRNKTQFVGALTDLRQTIQGVDKKVLKDYCAVLWRFITPAAPHQNGCAEALVKSRKLALKKAVGEHVLTPFELYTCLLEVANLVNQRPIGRPPNDPDDDSYLCPNDMLLGRASPQVPQGPFHD